MYLSIFQDDFLIISDADWVMVDVVDSYCVNKVVPHHALIHQISINLSRKSELKMHLMVEIEYLLTLIVLCKFWCGNENLLYKSCSNSSKYTVAIIFSVSGMIASQSVVRGQAKETSVL